MSEAPAGAFERLDHWLWCARVAKTRAACAAIAERGRVRINRQPTEKPHAKVRVGDVLTLALGDAERGSVRIWRVLALAGRRGPPAEARSLYEDLSQDGA